MIRFYSHVMMVKTSELKSLCSWHMMTTCTNCDGMTSSAVLMEVIDLDNLVNYLMNLSCGSDMSKCTCHNHGTSNTGISSEQKKKKKTPVGLHAH